MGVEIWFKEDLRNILISANYSSAATAQLAAGPVAQMYRVGYQAALMTVALACGISPDLVGIRPEVFALTGSSGASAPFLEVGDGSPGGSDWEALVPRPRSMAAVPGA